ncbi:MAG: Na/Pi cotransporter family protein [Bdellovibrionaceae bacterium]|nr:Na/Pi cotransporter family protein [Pseudobdellovibrionaceae bacterium]
MEQLHSSFSYTLAGIAFFMLGMGLASESLQKLASNRIRDLLAKTSDRPYIGVLVGIGLTVIVQSSGAVTSMLVGLSTAGMIKLKHVMSLIIGTAIGTTITVQILSLNISQYGLPTFTIAFFIYFLSKQRVVKHSMQVLMGFGLIFWGLELIGIGTSDLKQMDFFLKMLQSFKDNPFLTIAVTSLFTAIVHSSAVTIGFAMTLTMSGDISLIDAMYWVYGANIGTTATALLASAGGNYVGKQVALAHFLFKVASVLVFYFLTDLMAKYMIGENPMREVANAHTVFNILAGAMFYPFLNIGARMMEKLIPPDAKEFGVKFLERSHFESGAVALAHAEREAMRMADMVITMVKDSLLLFEGDNESLQESIKERDNRVDLLHREINLFLSKFAERDGVTSQEIFRLMNFVTDLESVGDVIDNTMLEMAKKKHALKIDFSEEGWLDLHKISIRVLELAELSISTFQLKDLDLASKVIYKKREIRKLEKSLRESHIIRLVAQKEATIKTSSIHLDVLSEYRRITGLMSNHVYSLLKETDQYNIMPRRES